jgi:putative ABC transport system permease protein
MLNNLKGQSSTHGGAFSLRRGLIVVQFAISIFLISSTLIVFDQLDLLRNKPLGFKKDLIINVPIQSANFNSIFGGVNQELRQKMNSFEDAIAKYPGVLGSTLSTGVPGFGMVNRNVIPEGFTAQDNLLSPVMSVDYDFIETYEIELIAGRGFSKDYGTDHMESFIVNENFLSEFSFGSPEAALGKKINMEGKVAKVVGVVKDFNFLPLNQAMRPLIMDISVPQFNTFSIKLDNRNIPETLSSIESEWNDFFPNETFNHTFLEESLAQAYNTQEQFGRLIGYFAFLAIFISCLGSYGLIMFIAARKRKEIGVRKVLGASVNQLMMLLSRQFLLLTFVSIAIAIPLTIYAANSWLDDFSYRISVSPISFGIASFITILLVLVTVSIQAFRAAIANPVHSLRSE